QRILPPLNWLYGNSSIINGSLLLRVGRISQLIIGRRIRETEMMRVVVEIECVGKIADAFDKAGGSSIGLQPEQVDLNYVHASNELHFHEIRVVSNNSEYFFGLVTPFFSIVGKRSGPFSMDSRIILPCCLFIMYSFIRLFYESYMSFSNIGGRLSAPERIALSARVVIVKFVMLKITCLVERLVSRAKVIENQVLDFSVILISSDSSKESVGMSTARVILFSTIPTTVAATAPTADLPVIHDDTLLIPTDTPTISPIVPTIPHIAPTIQKRVGLLRTHRLASRYLVDYSSSDHFTSDDSSRDSLHSSSCYVISNSPCDSLIAISAGPSRKRCRSPTTSVPVASPVRGALSPVRTNLLPPHKRFRDSNFVIDFEVSLEEVYVPYVDREIGLGVDVEDSYEPYTEPDIDPDVQADIDACIVFADDTAAKGTDVRVEIGTAVEDEVESSVRGMIEIEVDQVSHPVVSDDIVEPVREDLPKLVSADRSLEVIQRVLDAVMHEIYDHMVEIPVHRVRVIESV
nr:hypothetical protein [Tanacetum cinerariifolium]